MAQPTPRILLVDDEQSLQKLLAYPLRKDGYLRIDFDKRAVTLAGVPARLTYVEFEILAALARNPGRVYNRMVLLERVWGDASYRDPRTVDVHIRHLREKLERDPKNPELILTLRGVGYRYRDR